VQADGANVALLLFYDLRLLVRHERDHAAQAGATIAFGGRGRQRRQIASAIGRECASTRH
jgi:hypothetical protein